MVSMIIIEKITGLLISKKPNWINAFFNKVLFKFGFIPTAISDRKYFSEWEKKRFHISRNHFYHPIPDLSKLGEQYWTNQTPLLGINLKLPDQLGFLAYIEKHYSEEIDTIPITKDEVVIPFDYYIQNQNFTTVDGEVLYCMIRKCSPNTIIEIGSGYSTLLISKALQKNVCLDSTYVSKFISIEPYPRDFLKIAIPLLDFRIEKPIQEVELSLFENLIENDILFIDSTHVMKYGSDVEFELFKILPILKKGVIIHFHDIFWPENYPRQWVVDNGWFWNEQQFLQSFLMYNDAFEILWCSSSMHKYNGDSLSKIFRSYSDKERPGSLWLKKIK